VTGPPVGCREDTFRHCAGCVDRRHGAGVGIECLWSGRWGNDFERLSHSAGGVGTYGANRHGDLTSSRGLRFDSRL
jgi:hypothetical protein